MTFCTNCGQQNDDMSRVCTNCGTPLGTGAQTNQQNPYQTSGPSSYPPSGSAPYPPPPAGAAPTNPYGTPPPQPPYGSQPYGDPYGNQQQPYGSGYAGQPYGGMQPGAYAGGAAGGSLMGVGQKREPGMVILFTFLTCGIYGIWWLVTYAGEVKGALGRHDLNPGMDLLIGIITCGIWSTIAFWYKYPKLIMDLQRRVGLPQNDISTMTLLLGIFFAPAAMYIVQSELNKIWDASGGVR
ncbi:MAG TPA: DUF4234 domain-containing protein [Pyrinomonadaceae bacterium]|jgi:hypothetical protein